MDNISEQLNRSAISSTLTIPALLKKLSYIASSPAIDPVWVTAAFAPSTDLPVFTTMIGFEPANLLAALMNFLGFLIASMKSIMLLVSGSIPK